MQTTDGSFCLAGKRLERVWRQGPSWYQMSPDQASGRQMMGCSECWLRLWWLLLWKWWRLYLISAAPNVSIVERFQHFCHIEDLLNCQTLQCQPNACLEHRVPTCWAASLACFSWFSKCAFTSSDVFRLLPVFEESIPCDFSLSSLLF